MAKGGESYSNEPHISGGVPIAGTDRVSEDEKFFVSDYLGNTMMELPGKVESSKSRPWGNERSEIGKSTEFGKGRRDTAGFNFLTTAMGANVEVELAKSRRQGNERSEVGRSVSGDAPAMNRFTGKPYDEDLQAYVFPFRNYSAKLARWTSADPAGFPDGPNRHFYAPVPTSGLDPMGLEVIRDTRDTVPGNLLIEHENQERLTELHGSGEYFYEYDFRAEPNAVPVDGQTILPGGDWSVSVGFFNFTTFSGGVAYYADISYSSTSGMSHVGSVTWTAPSDPSEATYKGYSYLGQVRERIVRLYYEPGYGPKVEVIWSYGDWKNTGSVYKKIEEI